MDHNNHVDIYKLTNGNNHIVGMMIPIVVSLLLFFMTFPYSLGMSSSRLTNSLHHFSEG